MHELTAQEKALVAEVKGQTEALITEKTNGLIASDTFAQKVAALEQSIQTETATVKAALEATLKEQGIVLAELKANKGEGGKPMSQTEQITKAINDNADALASLSKGNNVKFTVKSAGDMTTSNYSGGYVGISQFDPVVGAFNLRRPFIRDIVNVRPMSDMYITWFDQANADGTAAAQTQGSGKAQIDFDLVEAKLPAETIAAYITVTKQAMRDLPYFTALVNQELTKRVNLAFDAELLTGDGTTPNLKGISTYSTPFTAPAGLIALVDNATIFDLLIAAQAQVNAENHMANYALMHPTDVARIRISKGTDGHYLTQAPNGLLQYAGINIIENTGVTQNTMYVIDSTKSNVGIREDFNITVGLDGNNFTQNKVTVLGELVAAHYIKSNDTTAFVKITDIDAAIATLELP